jgi:hypothetical protein
LFAFAALSPAPVATLAPASRPVAGEVIEMARPFSATPAPPSPATPIVRLQAPARGGLETRVVSLIDLPAYPSLDQDLVDRSIAALPSNRIWFTYAAIKECFGVSRATVARKVKKGLVPGIRFRGPNVLEDGPVRRFDRNQLRWLLLAVRAHS